MISRVPKSNLVSVLYFSNESVRGGVEEHLLTLLRGLDRQRFRPYLACTPELAEALAADLPGDVIVAPIRLRSPRDFTGAAALASLLRCIRAEILHSHLFFASLLAAPIARACRVPVVIETPHVREHWRHGWKASHRIDRWAARLVDRFIAVSESNAEYLRSEKGLPAAKVTTIRNGCDIARFQPDRAPSPELRRRYGVSPADPVLVMVARLEPQKGHEVLFAAMPRLLALHPRLKLLCVGDGALRGSLEARRRQLGLDQAVHFAGFQADIGAFLALATATVLPSHYEGLPLAAIESLAAGKPVLASAVDGTPEVVRNGETGLTFPAGNPDAIVDAVSTALADRDRCLAWGRAGRRLVEDQFSHRAQLRQTESLYLNTWEAAAHA
ncbi:MAG TPA: glycosyltransferase family 4 protein [Terriglobales bacterium]|nr:glycosyltransferase family 4 protein [Terriglobales bacterium]